jgi:hypothetical protein
MDHDRRDHPRFKMRVPVEIITEGSESLSAAPLLT